MTTIHLYTTNGKLHRNDYYFTMLQYWPIRVLSTRVIKHNFNSSIANTLDFATRVFTGPQLQDTHWRGQRLLVQRTRQITDMGAGGDGRGFRAEPDNHQPIEHEQRSVFVQQRQQNGNTAIVWTVRGRNKIRFVGQLAERRAEPEPAARGPQLLQTRRAAVRGQIRVRARSPVRPVGHTTGRSGRADIPAIRRHGIRRAAENTRMHLGDTCARGQGFLVTF